jgi:hypothetical protein
MMLADEIRLNDAIADKRRQLLDETSAAYARGTALMRDAATGPWQPLSDGAKIAIKAEMATRFPREAKSPHQAVIDANPRYAAVLERTLADSQSTYSRSPQLREGRGKAVALDRPGVLFGGSRPAAAGGSVDFDCKTGRPCSLGYPQGLAEHQKPVPLTLVGASWDPATADQLLDAVRWKIGAPVKILGPGEGEPE